LRERLLAAARGTFLTADQYAQLDTETGEAFAEAAAQIVAGQDLNAVRAIGSHGQTLAHAPDARPAYTLQIGNPARISENTGISTVADFRSRDIAAGGQGAPLVPAFHQAVFSDPAISRVILNIGGIANITHLPRSGQVTGFDTGPGNCLMDAWIQRHLGQSFDRNGDFASQGKAQQALLSAMQADTYFGKAPPKSTGTDHFSLPWVESQPGVRDLPPEDVQATLLQLSAESIAESIKLHAADAEEVLVCGGGVHNPALMAKLAQQLPMPVYSTSRLGLDPDWVEAIAFAWLAKQALLGLPGNLPAVTGARGPRVLGCIHPA
jgi:anhydro-N-acetylmuramic acid kinase